MYNVEMTSSYLTPAKWERQRKLALDTWREILERQVSWAGAEALYHELMILADEMEMDGLITDDEWRKLTRKAADVITKSSNS